MGKKNIFLHDSFYFSKHTIRSESNYYGVKKESLEVNKWIYEIIGQLQEMLSSNVVIKGGAASQLYLPIEFQRCTADIDFACIIDKEDIVNSLEYLKYKFTKCNCFFDYKEYIPKHVKDSFHSIEMSTFLLDLPFIFNKGRKKDLKIDFVYHSNSQDISCFMNKCNVLGLTLDYTPICVPKNILIAEKLLTFASNSIGLEKHRIDGYYKNTYDVYNLLNVETSADFFVDIAENLSKVVDKECKTKRISTLSTQIILDDISDTLFNFFTWDLFVKDPYCHVKVKKFIDSNIQQHIRTYMDIDTWAIMFMYIYTYISSIKAYIKTKQILYFDLINDYIDEITFIESLSKGERELYRKKFIMKISEWNSKVIVKNIMNINRMCFLTMLIEKNLI
ncbi:hypothetical protein Q428_14445 [Fervidicella metallireducens AeB]|uniref:Uncharacterized protein n=1 Tax=Fervidicella metallireducens AeB TaxID=1403537 RepID=A0A017RRF8_9CLOT|nr:nucleotidyl transferase AbiEii/AbiGii toxin family protein [Fervidicella metallireducens]EYE87232.1 hypothetical protein Q428_14445 [Fervidicella metallireducens AeB]